MTKHKIIQAIALPSLLFSLSVLFGACRAQPTSTALVKIEQLPTILPSEPNTSPTVAFDTVKVDPEEPGSPNTSQSIKPSDCPELESILFQITQAADPLSLAKQLQLKTKEGKIQVLLILNGKDTSFLEDFAVEIGTQVDAQVQAFVPIKQLCNLAKTKEVLAIRLPDQGMPQ